MSWFTGLDPPPSRSWLVWICWLLGHKPVPVWRPGTHLLPGGVLGLNCRRCGKRLT